MILFISVSVKKINIASNVSVIISILIIVISVYSEENVSKGIWKILTISFVFVQNAIKVDYVNLVSKRLSLLSMYYLSTNQV
jgi:hypothetical protein